MKIASDFGISIIQTLTALAQLITVVNIFWGNVDVNVKAGMGCDEENINVLGIALMRDADNISNFRLNTYTALPSYEFIQRNARLFLVNKYM